MFYCELLCVFGCASASWADRQTKNNTTQPKRLIKPLSHRHWLTNMLFASVLRSAGPRTLATDVRICVSIVAAAVRAFLLVCMPAYYAYRHALCAVFVICYWMLVRFFIITHI